MTFRKAFRFVATIGLLALPMATFAQNNLGNAAPSRYGQAAPSNDGRTGRYNAANAPPSQPRTFSATPTNRSLANNTTPVAGGLQRVSPAPEATRARVTKGSGKLPNGSGQVWREYDIRPYTGRATAGTTVQPQQAIVDWILRETGYEAWHSETFGILNANRETLTVYHTPAMQAIVADIVDRFVNTQASDRAFSMRIVTVRNPDWRTKAFSLMTPISVQSPGLQAWIMPKENYALLLSHLSKRSDIREYNAANQAVPNGQGTVFSTMRPRAYVKGVVPTQNVWPGYQPEMGQLEEGASLEFNPLLSLDLSSAEAVVKIRLNQVEKMRPVTLDLPSPRTQGGQAQRLQIEVPQLTMANLHERFRWPADQVLLLSMGMVATPGPERGNAFTEMLPKAMKSPPRADALLFLEVHDARSPSAAPGAGVSTASRPATTFTGRY